MRSGDVARLMVQLLLIAPKGSFAEYDADRGEIVVVVSDAGLMDRERRVKLHRALDERADEDAVEALGAAAGLGEPEALLGAPEEAVPGEESEQH